MTVQLYRKGPATVTYGGAVIGQTEGDVVVKYTPEWRMVVPDQTTGPQGSFLVREAFEVTVPLIPRADAYDLMRGNIFPAGLKKANGKDDDGASTVDGAHVAGDTTLAVADGSEFAQNKLIKIGTGASTEYQYISSISSDDLTLGAGLENDQDTGVAVVEIFGSYLSANEAAGQTVLSVNASTDFAAGDKILIGKGAKAEVRVVDSTGAGTVTITEPTAHAHVTGELVMELDSDPELKYSVGNNRSNVQFAELLITPLDGSDPIKVYKAICTGEVELALKKEEESVIELTFVGIEDTSRSDGDRLLAIGLQSVA